MYLLNYYYDDRPLCVYVLGPNDWIRMAATRSRYWLWWGDARSPKKCVVLCISRKLALFVILLSSRSHSPFTSIFPPRIPKPIWTIRYDRSCSSAWLSAGMYVYMCSKIMRAQHTTAGRPTTSGKMRTRWPSPQMKMKICYLCLPPHPRCRRRYFTPPCCTPDALLTIAQCQRNQRGKIGWKSLINWISLVNIEFVYV